MRKIILTLVAGALMAAVALPAAAEGPTTTTAAPTLRANAHWFAGTVSAVGTGSLTVGVLWTGPHDSSLNGQSVAVAVDSTTDITYGRDRTPKQLASIQVGDLVGVMAHGADLSSLTAAKIHVFCNCHWIGGTISSLGSNSLTVQVRRTGPYDTVLAGHAVAIGVNGSTTYILRRDKKSIQFSDLKVGQGVGVVFSADGFFKAPGFDPSKATFTAKQVHVWGPRQVPAAASDGSKVAQVTS